MLITLGILLAFVALFFTDYASIGRVPRGDRLERCQKSPNYKGGVFINQESTTMFTQQGGKKKSVVSIFWNFIFGSKKGLKPQQQEIIVEKMDTAAIRKAIEDKIDKVIWFGHSSYLLIVGGQTILVDPVLFRGSPISFINRPFKGTSIFRPQDFPHIDYLVITHDHYDHLDYKAVRKLKHKIGKVILPLGVGSHFEFWGYDTNKLIELDWNENYTEAIESAEPKQAAESAESAESRQTAESVESKQTAESVESKQTAESAEPKQAAESAESKQITEHNASHLTDGANIGDINFICTTARHFSGRSFKRNKTLWASFILQINGKCIFIGGDGGYGKHFKEIGKQYKIDYAFIENGQYDSRWAQIHTMPNLLHKVMEDLDAKHYITVHHNKFALAQHNWDEPLKNEKQASEQSGKNLIVLTIGHLTDL